MRITIVMGFFLPMPPAAGGATEKTWHGLARDFSRRGHDVTILSRRWPGWPNEEIREGVRHMRLRGFDHTPRLRRNLWLDLRWSLRAVGSLPAADVTIVNAIALPALLRLRRRPSGRLVVMTGRMPKGQYRFYGRIDRVLAVSSPVRDAIVAEKPRLAPVIRVTGYPIDWQTLQQPSVQRALDHLITIGYVGRIHREKGLHILVAALARLSGRGDLPAWRVSIRGPSDVERGGSGPDYVRELETGLATSLLQNQWRIEPPTFDGASLARAYQELDVFCYPSIAESGETFGVAVAEAMAAGAVPVVSSLGCFGDFVRHGVNGITFDHRSPRAAEHLADALADLLSDSARRTAMADAARAGVRAYAFDSYAERLLEDFSTLQ